jgi:hypothetical protein
MASWRENASPQAQQALDELLNVALGFAQQELTSHGEFFPYAVVMRADGQTELVAPRPEAADDQPASADMIAACRTTLAKRRDHLRAAALVADVRLPDGGDAVQVELEHTEGVALTVQLPYSKKRFTRDIDYGQLRAAAGARQVWL